MKRALLIIALLGAGAVLVPSAGANHPAGWHWKRTANPFVVKVINSSQSGWSEHVRAAADRWSVKSDVLDFDVVGGSPQTTCAHIPDVVHVCSGGYGAQWAGLTTVRLNGKHIQSATVKLNNSALSAARAVSCHELGHSIGLGHRPQSETTSCMTPSIAASQKRPDVHDLRQLKRIYKHADGAAASTGKIRVVRIYSYLAG